MKVKRYAKERNKLGGVHIREYEVEVPDPKDELTELREDVDDLKGRVKKLEEAKNK